MPDTDICTNCGAIVEKPKAEIPSVPEKRPSRAWYLVPIFFGILGGLAMYLVLKDEDRKMAKKGLILGIVLGAAGAAVVIIFYAILLGVLVSHYPNLHPSADMTST